MSSGFMGLCVSSLTLCGSDELINRAATCFEHTATNTASAKDWPRNW